MLQTSLLLMKSLNKTEIPILLSVVCSLFPRAIFLMFIYHLLGNTQNEPLCNVRTNAGPDQPAHKRRLIRAFIVRLQN